MLESYTKVEGRYKGNLRQNLLMIMRNGKQGEEKDRVKRC